MRAARGLCLRNSNPCPGFHCHSHPSVLGTSPAQLETLFKKTTVPFLWRAGRVLRSRSPLFLDTALVCAPRPDGCGRSGSALRDEDLCELSLHGVAEPCATDPETVTGLGQRM